MAVLGEGGLNPYPNFKRWFENVNARPAVIRARNIDNDIERKSDFDEESARALFPHNFDKIM